ncbi:hypothetical protein [Streptomyces sp. NPDC056192]
MTLDMGKERAEGAGEVVGVGESRVGHQPAPQLRPDAFRRIQIQAVGALRPLLLDWLDLEQSAPIAHTVIIPHE